MEGTVVIALGSGAVACVKYLEGIPRGLVPGGSRSRLVKGFGESLCLVIEHRRLDKKKYEDCRDQLRCE